METNENDVHQVTAAPIEDRKQPLLLLRLEVSQNLIARPKHLYAHAWVYFDLATLNGQAEDSGEQLNFPIDRRRRSGATSPIRCLSSVLSELLHAKPVDLSHLLILEERENWFRPGSVILPRTLL
jgi:hypothetical protein